MRSIIWFVNTYNINIYIYIYMRIYIINYNIYINIIAGGVRILVLTMTYFFRRGNIYCSLKAH